MAITPEMRLLATAYGFQSEDTTTFMALHKEVAIDQLGEEIERILRWCNGRRTPEEILELSGVDDELFEIIVTTLLKEDILVDARSLGRLFQKFSMHPLLATHDLSFEDVGKLTVATQKTISDKQYALTSPAKSGLLDLLEKRKSSRTFGEQPLSEAQLSGLLHAMYGTSDSMSSVPSAGGLYTLRVYLLLLKPAGHVPEGVYEYVRGTHSLEEISVGMISVDVANFLLDSEGVAANASAVICLGIDFELIERKYANRSYRFLLLESGHATQNAYLYCTEAELQIVEWGGFNDVELSRYLHLEYPRQGVATTIVVGTPTSDGKVLADEYAQAEWKMRKELMSGKNPSVKNLTFNTYTYRNYVMPRYVAHVEYFSADPDLHSSYEVHNTATGAGVSLGEASVKALAEAFERRASGFVRVDVKCPRSIMKLPIYDLCDVAPLRANYQGPSESPQHQDPEESWIKGIRLSDGQEIVVPIDQVFYPILPKHLGAKVPYPITSTGVAAHSDREKAIDAAFLELIERDAIAVTWYAKRGTAKIPEAYWPGEVKKRAKALKSFARRESIFCNLTLDSVPVVMCVLTSSTYPYLVTGSAAHWDYKVAMSKAQDEAEIALYSYRGYPRKKRNIEPENVKGVIDHSTLWASKKWSKELGWLWEGVDNRNINDTNCSRSELIRMFNPAVIDLAFAPEHGLSVVRVVSNILMPITFGYGAEHYRHPRLDMLGFLWSWSFPALPHCLA